MRLRKNDGFTLVELMVTILVSTLVAAAAATTILFGLRINKQSSQTQRQQSTTRILITALEDMVSEGAVGELVKNIDGTWELHSEGTEEGELGVLLCEYKDNALYTADGKVLMDNITADIEPNEDRSLLKLIVKTAENEEYTTSIRCRMKPKLSGTAIPDKENEALEDLTDKAEEDLDSLSATQENRMDFLNLLVTQRDSKGWFISDDSLTYEGMTYYSQWYITTAEGEKGKEKWEQGEWNADTPWCACFISWALNQQKNTVYIPQVTYTDETNQQKTLTWINEETKEPYWFADVDKFMAYFQLLHDEKLLENKENPTSYWVSMRDNTSAPHPNPGDIIFFDTDTRDTDTTPDHVGVVFHVDEATDTIYTIEGNSLGKVAIRQYSATNKTIIGYGVLPWIPDLDKLIVGKWAELDKEGKLTGKTISFTAEKTGTCFTENMTDSDCTWEFSTTDNTFKIVAKNIAGATDTIKISNIQDALILTRRNGDTYIRKQATES